MKEAYINCLKQLRNFRKILKIDKDIKRGKLYFTWIKDKTEIIENEKDENYIYTNVIKHTLPNYVITRYTFNKANKNAKSIIKANYTFKDNKYTFNNTNISVEDTKTLMKYVLFKRVNVVWMDFGFNIGNDTIQSVLTEGNGSPTISMNSITGEFKAAKVDLKGTIHATGGNIGGFSIDAQQLRYQ